MGQSEHYLHPLTQHDMPNQHDINSSKNTMTINEAFDRLREVVPSFPFEKRISKIETLRLALSYIELLMDTLNQSELPTDYLRRCANGEIKETKRWKTTGK